MSCPTCDLVATHVLIMLLGASRSLVKARSHLQRRGEAPASDAALARPESGKSEAPSRTTGPASLGDLFTNSVGTQPRRIPAGEFHNAWGLEVRISRDFYLGIHEVTQAAYRAVTEGNPSGFQGDDLPVERVSWEEADTFCRLLTEREQALGVLPSGMRYRLPTEAEWEYAARAGTTTGYCLGDDEAALAD